MLQHKVYISGGRICLYLCTMLQHKVYIFGGRICLYLCTCYNTKCIYLGNGSACTFCTCYNTKCIYLGDGSACTFVHATTQSVYIWGTDLPVPLYMLQHKVYIFGGRICLYLCTCYNTKCIYLGDGSACAFVHATTQSVYIWGTDLPAPLYMLQYKVYIFGGRIYLYLCTCYNTKCIYLGDGSACTFVHATTQSVYIWGTDLPVPLYMLQHKVYISGGRICLYLCTCYNTKRQSKLASSPDASILTQSQPVLALSLQYQPLAMVATRTNFNPFAFGFLC